MAYSILGRVDASDRDHLNSLFFEILEKYGPRFNGYIEIHVGNTGYYENHIEYLMRASLELGMDGKITVIKHSFDRHENVVPVFLNELSTRLAFS